MARFTQPYAWLTTVYQRLRRTTPQWFGHRTSPPHIDDGSPGLSVRVQSNAAVKEYELMPDGKLLQLIALRDQQALDTLYARHGRLVFSLALHITAEQLSAEDVTQDVFVLVWEHSSVFRSRAGSVQGWLAAMTRQRAVDTVQSPQCSAGRRAVALNDTIMAVPCPEEVCDPQGVARDMVREALNSLPVIQRQAIERAYYAGLTAAEIASVAHEPVDTIKSRLRLAMTTIRQAVYPDCKAEQLIAQDEQRQTNDLERARAVGDRAKD